MESITRFRHMMADQKYYEVQKLVEAQLLLVESARLDLLKIYCEVLQVQEKKIPTIILFELANEELLLNNFSDAIKVLETLTVPEIENNFLKISLLKINIYKSSGRTQNLYDEISHLLIQLFTKQLPSIPEEVSRLSDQFFRNDFHLGFLKLSFSLLVNNIPEAEVITRHLILSCMERSSVKGIKDKLTSISEILKPAKDLMPLKIYQNFCEVYVNGIQNSKDIKKVIEMVIHFDDFMFQAQTLNIMLENNLVLAAEAYALVVQKNKSYSFIYFNKYLPSLKKLFVVEKKLETEENKKVMSEIDLKLEDKFISEIVSAGLTEERFDDEDYFKSLIRYQDFISSELCDIAVGFIQSEMPSVALVAANEAIKKAQNSNEILKGKYLKLNIELMLKDFRAAQDTCFEALKLASTKDDILSFMYGQAEALIRIDDKSAARRVLRNILDIDVKYRLAKERLDKLNEI